MNLKKGIILFSLLFLGACSGSGSSTEDPAAVPNAPSSPSAPSDPSNLTPSSPEPTVIQAGDYDKTITIGTDQRSYILHVPANYDGSKALPLIFMLHGHGGTAKSMVKSTGLNEKGDQENFFVAYLQGSVGSDGKPGWNTGVTPNSVNVDDVAFVREVAKQLEDHLKVDAKRIYAAGFSNGGIMTHRLGQEIPDLFAGLAVAEGTIGTQQDDGTWLTLPAATGSVPMLIIHGEQDHTIPYFGQNPGGVGHVVKSAAEALLYWTGADECVGLPAMESSADGNIITQDYKNCADGTEVELLTIVSGEHQWPTLDNAAHFSGTDASWEFFARHSKN